MRFHINSRATSIYYFDCLFMCLFTPTANYCTKPFIPTEMYGEILQMYICYKYNVKTWT